VHEDEKHPYAECDKPKGRREEETEVVEGHIAEYRFFVSDELFGESAVAFRHAGRLCACACAGRVGGFRMGSKWLARIMEPFDGDQYASCPYS